MIPISSVWYQTYPLKSTKYEHSWLGPILSLSCGALAIKRALPWDMVCFQAISDALARKFQMQMKMWNWFNDIVQLIFRKLVQFAARLKH